MKKIILLIGLFGLTGCVDTAEEFVKDKVPSWPSYEAIAKDLEATKDPWVALEVSRRVGLSDKGQPFVRKGVSVNCWQTSSGYYIDSSDECILERRRLPESKVSFFDYERFLPSNTWIKSEEDFHLVQWNVLYHRDPVVKACEVPVPKLDEYEEYTQEELKQQREQELEADKAYARCVVTSPEAEAELKGQIIAEQQERELKVQRESEAIRKQEERDAAFAECQAKVKAAGLVHFNDHQVRHIKPDGVLVACYNCYDMVFVYTSKKYANNETINNKYYYKYVGMYETKNEAGEVERYRAYKQTDTLHCVYSAY